MCGLLGYSGTKSFDLEKIKILYLWNSLSRGEDATGLYSPENGIIKDNEPAHKFIKDKLKKVKLDNLLIGHVRHSTVGWNNASNAHPFKRDSCILAHNGTLSNHYALKRKYDLGYASGYDVDSDVLAGCIAKTQGLKVLSEIDGSAALLIGDTRNPYTMYVFRNKERPLFNGLIGNNMYISSIKESLELIECTNISEFEEDRLYTISKGKIVSCKKIKNEPYKESYTSYSSRNQESIEVITEKTFGCMVKAKSDACYINNNKKECKLIKNHYYEIVGKVNDFVAIIYDPISGDEFSVNYHNLDLKEVILTNDYIMSNSNIVYKGTDVVAINQGECFKCTFSDSNGTLCVSLPNGELIYAKKKLFRKISKEAFEASTNNKVIDIQTFVALSVMNQINNTTPSLTSESDDTATETNIEDVETEEVEEYDEIDNELQWMYPTVIEELTEIRTQCENQDVGIDTMNKIDNLLQLIQDSYESIYPSEEEEEVENAG
jgi:hypothetical protein